VELVQHKKHPVASLHKMKLFEWRWFNVSKFQSLSYLKWRCLNGAGPTSVNSSRVLT